MPFRSAASYQKNCKQLSPFWSRPTSVQAGRSNPSVKEIWTGSDQPVSNLPFISKLLEKVILTQLQKHLSENDLLEIKQSAYRKNHNTETALLSVFDGLLRNADDRLVSVLALLDLSAAFDTLDHPWGRG